ncbi:MAG: RNA polymerase sigma factor [bacterium]|nr:RNA polymerase sigma factor [bacterium]
MTTEEELLLATRAQTGDKEALGLLWDAITPKLYGYCMNTLRDKTLAEDVYQQTWLKAIANIQLFKPRGVRFSAWLFAIARNECRQQWRTRTHEPIDALHDDLAQSTTPRYEERLLIENILNKLSETEREILQLRYIADLSFREIASVLNISTISARVRAHRAIAQARKFI